MFRILTSMLFILTHSVLAQASGFNGAYRMETQNWVASYAGETEVDGLPVTVILEEARNNLGIPDIMVGASSLVPMEAAPAERTFRLSFIVSHNPAIRTHYVIRPRTVSVDGALRLAYVSDIDQRDFQFQATVQPDSTVLVSYVRKTPQGASLTGQIALSPVPRVLTK